MCMLVASCASHPRASSGADLAPLRPEERITIDFRSRTSILCFGPPNFEIDQQGFLRFGTVTVQVAGLTPPEAALKIRDAFMPSYYSDLQVEVRRPQPQHAADASQPFSSPAMPTSSTAVSHR